MCHVLFHASCQFWRSADAPDDFQLCLLLSIFCPVQLSVFACLLLYLRCFSIWSITLPGVPSPLVSWKFFLLHHHDLPTSYGAFMCCGKVGVCEVGSRFSISAVQAASKNTGCILMLRAFKQEVDHCFPAVFCSWQQRPKETLKVKPLEKPLTWNGFAWFTVGAIRHIYLFVASNQWS